MGRLGGLANDEIERGEKALWLAGGGFRAALFHLGALTRLNELGLLARTGTVGAVAGGSIVAALLATRVPWPLHGAYRDWPEQVAEPLREITRRNIRARSLLRRPLGRQGGTRGALRARVNRRRRGRARWGVGLGAALRLRRLGADAQRARRRLGGLPRVESRAAGRGWLRRAARRRDDRHRANRSRRLRRGRAGGARKPRLPARRRGAAKQRPDHSSRDRAVAAAAAAAALDGSRAGPRRARRQLPPDADRSPPPAPCQARRARTTAALARADRAARAAPAAAPLRLARVQPRRLGGGDLLARHARRPQQQPPPRRRHPDRQQPRSAARCRGSSSPSSVAASYADGQPAASSDHLDECGGSLAADALALRADPELADVVYGRARRGPAGSTMAAVLALLLLRRPRPPRDRAARGRLAADPAQARGGRRAADRDAGARRRLFAADLGSRSRRRPAKTGRWRSSIPPVARTRRCRGPGPSRRRSSPTTTTAAARWCGRGCSRSATTVPAGSAGRGAGARPAAASTSRPRARAGQGGGPSGGIRPSSNAKRGPGTASTIALDGPAPPPRRSCGPAARTGWRWSSTRSPSRRRRAAPARLVAAPVDAAGEAGPVRALALEGRRGSFALQLPPAGDWAGVRAGAASERGLPGPVAEVPIEG